MVRSLTLLGAKAAGVEAIEHANRVIAAFDAEPNTWQAKKVPFRFSWITRCQARIAILAPSDERGSAYRFVLSLDPGAT